MGSMLMEVVDKDVGVGADVSKVNASSSSLEEKQAIEIFEESGVGLVDGAEDGLACCSKFLEESDDVECGL